MANSAVQQLEASLILTSLLQDVHVVDYSITILSIRGENNSSSMRSIWRISAYIYLTWSLFWSPTLGLVLIEQSDGSQQIPNSDLLYPDNVNFALEGRE